MGKELYEICFKDAEVRRLPDSSYLGLNIPNFGAFVIPNDVQDLLEMQEGRKTSYGVRALLVDSHLSGIKSLDGRIILDNTSDLDIDKRGFAFSALHELDPSSSRV